MQVLTSPDSVRAFREALPSDMHMGFVPTMGALHDGHLSLVRASQQQNDITIVSIFVNPLQFSPSEDFSNYPRTWDKDRQLLEAEGVDAVFLPSGDDMYPEPLITTVAVAQAFSSRACGAFRPNHFEGVATVVLKLFQMVGPCNAYFGLKDYQQFILIKHMIRDFNLPATLVGLPTRREEDGLAMSSRNTKLTPEDRELAPAIYKTLLKIRDRLLAGNGAYNPAEVFDSFCRELANVSNQFRVQYLQCYDRNFEPITEMVEGDCVLVAAVYLGDVRLIDNILF